MKNELSDQLTYDQFCALRYIYKERKITATDLVHVLYVNKSSISTLIRRMEDKKLIVRDQTQTDRRKICLSLSEKGRHLYEACEQRINALVKEIINSFTEEEIEQFFIFNKRLNHFFDEKIQLMKGTAE